MLKRTQHSAEHVGVTPKMVGVSVVTTVIISYKF